MEPRLAPLMEQYKGIVEDMGKTSKDASVEAVLLALIASLLFVLIEKLDEEK